MLKGMVMNAMIQHRLHPAFVDQFGRSIYKLRISVTDRCNFKCVYCMPEHPEWVKKHDLLSFDELYQFCDFMVQHGIEHIRITGGEPLMRQGVVYFVEQLQKLKKIGLKKISMTSNAHYLKKYALPLKQAGLDNINISLDSLDVSQFKTLTKKEIQPVLDGIFEAKRVGLPIKINTVLIKGVNEDQILPLAKWSIEHQFTLRFIEFMPLDGDAYWTNSHVVTEQEILTELKQEFDLTSKQGQSSEPARQYFINGHQIGIISTISNSFCGTCDRVRLTAQGDFYNCLFSAQGISLKSQIKALNDNVLTQTESLAKLTLAQTLSKYIWLKEKGFYDIYPQTVNSHSDSINHSKTTSRKISMYMIGG